MCSVTLEKPDSAVQTQAGSDDTAICLAPVESFEALRRRFDQRHNGVSSAHVELRTGIPGVIRSDITPDQLSNLLNDQLMQYSPADVRTIIGEFPIKLREHAQLVLSKAASFGSLESLRDLAIATRKEKIFLPFPGSLAETLSYTCNTKQLFSVTVTTDREIKLGTALILDKPTLDLLERDESFAREVANLNLRLVNPRGLISGINLFNGVGPDEIRSRVEKILSDALFYQSQSTEELGFDRAVDLALDAQMVKQLLKVGTMIGVGDKLLGQIVHVEAQTPGTEPVDEKGLTLDYTHETLQNLITSDVATIRQEENSRSPSSWFDNTEIPDLESIALRLNGLRGMSADEVKQELDKLPEGYRASASEIVAQTSTVCSTRTFSYELRAMHGSIQEAAASRGVSPDNIYYFIPAIERSFGLVALAYMYANDVPSDRFINSPTAAKKDSLIVILDDLSGSGDCLVNSIGHAKAHESQQALGAPIIATYSSLERFSGIQGRSIETLGDSALVNQLEPSQTQIIAYMIGGSGYKGGALCVSFPHMSPDNNCAFWSTCFAQYFTLSDYAIKGKGNNYQKPDEDAARQIATPALTEHLRKAREIILKQEVDFPGAIQLSRTIDSLVSVASKFRIELPEQLHSTPHKLRERLVEECRSLVHQSEHLIQAGNQPVYFEQEAKLLAALSLAETYFHSQTGDPVSRELLPRIKTGITSLAQRVGQEIDTEIALISANETDPSVELSTLSHLCERASYLRKIVTVVDRSSESLTKVQSAQLSAFERIVEELKKQQAELSQALYSATNINVISLEITTLSQHITNIAEVLKTTVPRQDYSKWCVAQRISAIRNIQTELEHILNQWKELSSLEQGAIQKDSFSFSVVTSLIHRFLGAGNVAGVSPHIFIDRAMPTLEKAFSDALIDAEQSLGRGTFSGAAEAEDSMSGILNRISRLSLATERNLQHLTTKAQLMRDAGRKAIEARVEQAIQELCSAKIQDFCDEDTNQVVVRKLRSLDDDDSLPWRTRNLISQVWTTLEVNIQTAVTDLVMEMVRGDNQETSTASLHKMQKALASLNYCHGSKLELNIIRQFVSSVQEYHHERQIVYEWPLHDRLWHFVSKTPARFEQFVGYPPFWKALSAMRNQLCEDIRKTMRQFLDIANGVSESAPDDHASILEILSKVETLFPDSLQEEIQAVRLVAQPNQVPS